MRTLFLCVFTCVGMAVRAWGGIIGLGDASQFTADQVNWCAQSGLSCDGSQYASAETWVSNSLTNTGTVGLFSGSSDFYDMQQGLTPPASWGGNFPDGMGLIFNGDSQSAISLLFDQAQYGVGAYIQSNYYGPFLATLTLYGAGSQVLGSYSAHGNSNGVPGAALYVGAWDSTQEVYGATFTAVGTGGQTIEPSFSIGSLGLAGANITVVPEPATMLLIGTVLGALGLIRRRRR